MKEMRFPEVSMAHHNPNQYCSTNQTKLWIMRQLNSISDSYLIPRPKFCDAPSWLKLETKGREPSWAVSGNALGLAPEKGVWLEERLGRTANGLRRRLSKSTNLELSKFLSLSTCTEHNHFLSKESVLSKLIPKLFLHLSSCWKTLLHIFPK